MSDDRATGVKWGLIKREHVAQACDMMLSGSLPKAVGGRGLFVLAKGKKLPAKDVARVAYLLAIGKPVDTRLKFASGQATLDMFQRLGFQVERVVKQTTEKEG